MEAKAGVVREKTAMDRRRQGPPAGNRLLFGAADTSAQEAQPSSAQPS